MAGLSISRLCPSRFYAARRALGDRISSVRRHHHGGPARQTTDLVSGELCATHGQQLVMAIYEQHTGSRDQCGVNTPREAREEAPAFAHKRHRIIPNDDS
jgi:hypothetical protein